MKDEVADSYLRELVCEYTSHYGLRLALLDKHIFYVTDISIAQRVPGAIEILSDGLVSTKLVDIIRELEHHGFIRRVDMVRFLLTKSGFERASMSWYEKVGHFLNGVPGLSHIIALVALAVSVLALVR